jgi:hypothetical protein
VPLAFARLVVAVAAAWGAAPTAESATTRAVVVPIAVSGELEPAWKSEFGQRLRAGLERGEAEIAAHETAASCRDDACWGALARAANAAFVVSTSVAIVERDYDIRIDVRSGRDGRVVVSVDQRCELCGLGEAAAQLSDMAAAVAGKLDALATAKAVLAIESVPGGADITLGGAKVGRAPLVREVVPGTHSVGASLSGYRTQARDVEAVAGVQQLVRFELVEATLPGRKHLRNFGWAALALGGAAVIAGAPLVAIDERPVTSRCTGEDVNAFGVCKYRYDTLVGGAVLIGVGAAAIITGTVIAVVTRKKKSRSQHARLDPGIVLRF